MLWVFQASLGSHFEPESAVPGQPAPPPPKLKTNVVHLTEGRCSELRQSCLCRLVGLCAFLQVFSGGLVGLA